LNKSLEHKNNSHWKKNHKKKSLQLKSVEKNSFIATATKLKKKTFEYMPQEKKLVTAKVTLMKHEIKCLYKNANISKVIANVRTRTSKANCLDTVSSDVTKLMPLEKSDQTNFHS
jgi:hypothetical protein